MSWVLLDDNFATHPKVMAAVHIHPLARDLFVCALCYCRKFQTDGTVPRSAMKTIGFVGNERKACDALLHVGLLDRSDAGFQIHDYAKFYPSDADDKAQREERSRQKREAGRKGGLASWAKRAAEPLALTIAEAEPKQPASSSAEAHSVPIQSIPTPSEERRSPVRAPLVTKRRGDAAVEVGRLYVPQRIHSDFLSDRNHPDAERELLAWYEAIGEEWTFGCNATALTGGDMFKFWRARYAEKWPAADTGTKSKLPISQRWRPSDEAGS